MKTTTTATIGVMIAAALLFSGCNKKQDSAHSGSVELTAEQNRYIHVGEHWGTLSNLKSTEGYDIKIYSKSQKYKIGEEMSFGMTSNKDGLLYILYTSQSDKTMLLYPNDLSRDNTVHAGQKITIPAKDNSWHMKASEPAGKSLLTFFVFPNKAMADKKLGNIVKMPFISKEIVLVDKEEFGVDSVTVEVTE